MRPIQATIHLNALAHNLNIAKAKAPKAKVMAVIKANGYGHGLLNAALGLKEADGFAVLSLDEALALRSAGYQQTILLLEGAFSASELQAISQHQISLVVHCDAQIDMLCNAQLPHPVSVHLKLNTGMNRLGFVPAHFPRALDRLKGCGSVANITLMTHFATADEPLGIAQPLTVFNQVTKDLEFPKSLANSATILRFSEAHADWVRAGIMLYGSSPTASETAESFGLKSVMQLSSKILAVQNLEIGDALGYGRQFIATKKIKP